MMMLILKIAFIFVAILFTLVNINRTYNANRIPAINFIMQAIGIVGFIVLQWLI
jgi:hypothetical protein